MTQERTALDKILLPANRCTGELLQRHLQTGKIAFYGAGQTASHILHILSGEAFPLVAIADDTQAKKGQVMGGVQIMPPEELYDKFGPDMPVIVTMLNLKTSFARIKSRLTTIGFKNVFSFLELFYLHPDKFLPYYQFARPERIIRERKLIGEAYELFKDDKSKEIFRNNLDYRVNLRFENIPQADNEYYFPSDIYSDDYRDCIYIDCGAYNGDTLDIFFKKGLDIKKVYAFEPDPQNFISLLHYVSGVDAVAKEKTYLFHAGIGEKHQYLRFASLSNMGSAISETGESVIQTISLDDHLLQPYDKESAYFIKMDIEGEEKKALKGSTRLLKECMPMLAISIYHCPDDLWTIPLLIHQIQPRYEFFLRQHGPDGMDLVLYTKPLSN